MYRSLRKATSLLIGDFYNQFFKQNVNQGMGQSIKVNTVVTKVRFFIHKIFFFNNDSFERCLFKAWCSYILQHMSLRFNHSATRLAAEL